MEVELYECTNCGALSVKEWTETEALYACEFCGEQFTRSASLTGDGHQCPNDGKFGSKVTDTGCTECTQGELELILGWECEICEALFTVEDDYTEHLKQNHPDEKEGEENV